MIFLTIFICTLFLKSTVIDSINPVASYYGSTRRLGRNADFEEESGELNSALLDSNSESGEEIETRMTRLRNKNKNILVHLGHPKHHHLNEKPEVKKPPFDLNSILLKLRTAHILRDNVISIMGYILQLPSEQLPRELRVSLEMIYNALRKKTIYMYNVLPALKKMRRKKNSYQLGVLLNRLMPNFPPHLVCAGKFVVKQILSQDLEVDNTLALADENFDVMAGISDEMIEMCSTINTKDEIKGSERGSKVIAEVLGPVYAKIFQEISLITGEFPQALFGIMLLDLPNNNEDPIFEEYIRYIAEETQHNRIPNWNIYGRNLKSKDPQALIINLVDDICQDEKVPLKLKKALLYVRDRFISGSREKKSIEDLITENGFNLDYLISSTIPQGSDKKIEKLKAQFQSYLNDDEELVSNFVGKGRYAYSSPRELLLALLARSQMKASEHTELQKIISTLLGNVVLTESTLHETLFDDAGPLWITIDAVDDPNNAKILEMSEYLIHELSKNLSHWDLLKPIIGSQKSECILQPNKCISETLKKLKLILTNQSADPKLLLTLEQLIAAIPIEREGELSCTQGASNFSERQRHRHRHHHRHKSARSTTTETPDIMEETTVETIESTLPPTTSVEIETVMLQSDDNDAEADTPSLLPQSIDPNACALVVIPFRGPPSVKSIGPGDAVEDGILLPSIVDLHEVPSNETHLLRHCSEQFDERIAKPLVEIYGENYIEKIVGHYNWHGRFPTRLALIITLLRKATWDADVQERAELMSEIERTLAAVEFLGSFVFPPLISYMENFASPVLWVTFANFTEDLRYGDLNRSMVVITSEGPRAFETGTISTMPVVNPKVWLEPVLADDPFPGLLPELPKYTAYEIRLRPLVKIFQLPTISSLLGEDIEPQLYPNTGALFVLTLQRLREIEEVKRDTALLTLIENYLNVIIPTSMYINVPAVFIAGNVRDSNGSSAVDLVDLMKALPAPSSKAETSVWNSMKNFLSKINILGELGIPSPSLVHAGGELLSTIIKTALNTAKIIKDDRLRRALIYYKDKVLRDDAVNSDWIKIKKIANKPMDTPMIKEKGQFSLFHQIMSLLKGKGLETDTKETLRRLLNPNVLAVQQN